MPWICRRLLSCLFAIAGLLNICAFSVVPGYADEPDAAARDGWRRMSELGSGFVIWESNRTGQWRIWRRELDGSGLRQISPDEKGRDHFCPHLSPDGSRLVYLSYRAGEHTYDAGPPKNSVQMYLLSADGKQNRQLAAAARAYYEDRAAVWLNDYELNYIGGDGLTHRLDVDSGKSLPLTKQLDRQGGWLLNAKLTHATTGEPSFSIYNPTDSSIHSQGQLQGCQPYFTHDGEWGLWMGGAGGPINRFNLKTRQVSPILNLSDPRMPKNRNYLYFPMISRDGRLFTFAASPNQHDHFSSDYDVFVAPMNPRTLELTANPVRYTFDSANDRFPDVYLKPTGSETPQSAGVGAPAKNPNASSASSPWPSNRQGLVVVYETGNAANQVPGRDGRPARIYSLRPRGRARWNHNQTLVLTRGSFVVDDADEDLLSACRQSQQLTVEAVIQPDHLNQTGPARIVTFSSSAYSRNFTLAQEGDKLIFRLRTPTAGENGVNPETPLTTITANEPTHVAVTYQPGQLAAYINGREVYRGSSVQGDFSNWVPQHLLFGDEFDGSRNWAGALEGIAVYKRALDSAEIQRNSTEYLRMLKSRKPVPQVEVTARLLAKSSVPTLDEVKPYRGALMVCKYEVVQVLRGKLPEKQVLVTQWALLDGQTQPVAGLNPGAEVRLVLEATELNPQLQRFVCKDRFDADDELLLPRYYDATP